MEAIITIFVISVGVLTAYAAVQQIFSYTFLAKSKLTAAYLAKEGIENIRNIRDTNWLQGNNWKDNVNSTDWITHPNPNLSKYETRTVITPDGDDKLEVLVEVRWQQGGATRTIGVQENLWNWYK